MLVQRLRASRSSVHPGAGDASLTVRPLSDPPVAAPLRDVDTQPRGGIAHGSAEGFEPRLNERTSAAQQALEFLQRLGAGLQTLRDSLARRLAPGQTQPSAAAENNSLAAHIRAVDACWAERPTATAGTLNGRLVFSPGGGARQSFTVRGLDFESLRADAAVEILHLSVGSAGHRPGASVRVDPGVSNETLVYRFDRALAQSGIRVSLSSGGALTFNTQESMWPLVRDTFRVMGEGRRFSTGRFGRVHVIPEPAVLQPETWSSKDIASLRALRMEIFNAQAEVRRAHRIVADDLADSGVKLLRAVASGESMWCAEFAGMFETAAAGASYAALTAVFPAVTGISRERVLNMLSG